jgi:hypothetical protein
MLRKVSDFANVFVGFLTDVNYNACQRHANAAAKSGDFCGACDYFSQLNALTSCKVLTTL